MKHVMMSRTSTFLFLLSLATLAFVLAGCESQRLEHLEKQTKELEGDVRRQSKVADYDLQSKCAREAKACSARIGGPIRAHYIWTIQTITVASLINASSLLSTIFRMSRLTGPTPCPFGMFRRIPNLQTFLKAIYSEAMKILPAWTLALY